VNASRGKLTRAEPISALYEQGRIHHVGSFNALEDEMCLWLPGDPSPNRMDALVWALTDLMLGSSIDWVKFIGE
jgi:phage terminase large subunit-like protein